jgi:two-component system, NarL family, sensor histidine kinase UhpB
MLPRMRAAQKAVWRDTLVVACATATMAILCAQFDFSEALRRWTAPWERFQLDELPAVLVVLAAGLAWLAARRYAEAGRELRRRESAESQLEAALADNRRLSQQYVLLQEAERKSLARELHDELGQYLNVIKLDAVTCREGLAHGSSGHTAGLHERAEAIIANCNHIHAALTSLIRQLRPVGLDELGLAAALEHCVDTWRPRLPEARLDLHLIGELDDLTEAVKLTVYRVLQEGLNNVAKHARARRVAMEVQRTGEPGGPVGQLIRVTIVDDGIGMDTKAPTQGLGLIGMRERVAALAGQLEITSAPGRGFELRARIPVNGDV